MSEVDRCVDASWLSGSGADVAGVVLAGTVTWLMADAEGLTRLAEVGGVEVGGVAEAITRLYRVVSESVAAHGGVRPVAQAEGGSVVVAFARASDAVGCALDLQRAALAPMKLRVSLHTGELQVQDDDFNYTCPTVIQAARLLELAHGGQTVLSATTGDLVVDGLPVDAWLADLGSHRLRDLPRPVRVMQLCHRSLRNTFPALQTVKSVTAFTALGLAVPLTTFVGRSTQIIEVQALVVGKRLLTLSGPGGVGKTRLALQVAAHTIGEFPDGQWFVDLAPVTDPDMVAIAVVRALGLADQPGCPIKTREVLSRYIGDRRMLVVLDSCEHLVDACAELLFTLLRACPAVTFLTTSREPIGVAGEVTWRVCPLSLASEAVELFTDRAGLVQPGFSLTEDNTALVSEICRRLDGIPLAIELAAARIRTLSLAEIAAGLDNRFSLLTGGARTAVRRQQTLRACMDWSHALLTDSEQILFRRLAVFPGAFDLTAVQAIAGQDTLDGYHFVDQLTQLVDKSLVMATDNHGCARYQLLETARQYAQEKLDESSEAPTIHNRHRDHYTQLVTALDTVTGNDHEQRIQQAETEITNLRAAFTWDRTTNNTTHALQLACVLQPIWFGRVHMHEGLAWFDSILGKDPTDHLNVPAPILAQGLANKVMLHTMLAHSPAGGTDITAQAQQALAIARNTADPAALVRALTACGFSSGYDPQAAHSYFTEATELAHTLDDKWTLNQILYWKVVGTCIAGDPTTLRTATQTAQNLAEAIGDQFVLRQCRLWRSMAHLWQGNLTEAITQSHAVTTDAQAATDTITQILGLYVQARALAHHDPTAAQHTAHTAVHTATTLGGIYQGLSYAATICAALAAGDITTATQAADAGQPHLSTQHDLVTTHHELMAQSALAQGDTITARRYADDAIRTTKGWHLMTALTTRARIAITQDEPEQARDDLHAALTCATDTQAYLGTPDTLELLAQLIHKTGRHPEAARLYGAASQLRQQTNQTRFKTWDTHYHTSLTTLHETMGTQDFNSAWNEGTALTTDEAILYAQRGRGKRKRPATGWESLTPAEHNIVRLISQGQETKDIATRLFVSIRTVQTHLTRIYTKLNITSRLQLIQEAARHT